MTPKILVDFPVLTRDVDRAVFFRVPEPCSSTVTFATVEYTSEQEGKQSGAFFLSGLFFFDSESISRVKREVVLDGPGGFTQLSHSVILSLSL